MLNEQEVSALIQSDKPENTRKERKKVTWVDGQDNGKIDEKLLDVRTFASPKKKLIDKQHESANRHSFFSLENVGIGVVALGVAVTIGMALSSRK